MADLEHASPGDTDLHGDTSALNWAQRFASKCGPPDVTGGLMFFGDHTLFERAGVEALMLTWFAGAIGTGQMAGQKAAGDIRAVHEVQGRDGNWDYSPYMCGLFNGLELALAITEGRDPAYRERPESGWRCDHAHPALPDGFAADVAGASDPDPASGGPAAGSDGR